MTKRIVAAFFFTLFGLCLFTSYFVFADSWAALDKTVFYFFNTKLIPDSPFTYAVAYSNLRVFDAISFVAMGLLYLYYFQRQDNKGRRTMICLGLCMLLAGVLIKQCAWLLPIAHPSPTYFFDDAVRVSRVVEFATKDADRNSFPGDHGMMLMVFAAFMARYFGRRAFTVAVLVVVIFSLPRIMSGAHWFSDIYMGSFAIACMTLSWLLLTPASDWCAAKMEQWLPAWFFPKGGTRIFG